MWRGSGIGAVSVFALYAFWGVDFVKMDDMIRPYNSHAPKIEAAHRAFTAAIDR